MMTRAKAIVLSGVLIALAAGSWAVPGSGAAHFPFNSTINLQSRIPVQKANAAVLPRRVKFREAKSRGLLTSAWLNDRGPFTVALDTGAGISVISDALARDIGARHLNTRTTRVAGLSGREVTAREAVVDRTALGDRDNVMPGKLRVLIAPQLPAGVDAIVDPTEAFAPLGYSIDLPNGVISALNPKSDGLDQTRPPNNGAVVAWLRDGQGNRPFVRLSDGRKALIDTGSNFGLALSRSGLSENDQRARVSRDVGGGTISSRRVAPTTVSIGDLVLRDVPTDLLDGVEKGAPVILGRDALYPFRLSFDPVRRLIEIVPSGQDN